MKTYSSLFLHCEVFCLTWNLLGSVTCGRDPTPFWESSCSLKNVVTHKASLDSIPVTRGNTSSCFVELDVCPILHLQSGIRKYVNVSLPLHSPTAPDTLTESQFLGSAAESTAANVSRTAVIAMVVVVVVISNVQAWIALAQKVANAFWLEIPKPKRAIRDTVFRYFKKRWGSVSSRGQRYSHQTHRPNPTPSSATSTKNQNHIVPWSTPERKKKNPPASNAINRLCFQAHQDGLCQHFTCHGFVHPPSQHKTGIIFLPAHEDCSCWKVRDSSLRIFHAPVPPFTSDEVKVICFQVYKARV